MHSQSASEIPSDAIHETVGRRQNYKRLGQSLALYVIAGASFALALVILHRWLVTPMGQASFGRVWQYYASWTEFGFFRRGLVGTFLTVTGLNSITRDEYAFTYGFYTLQLAALYAIFVAYLRRQGEVLHWRMLVIIFFSPALFLQAAYATGSHDLLLLLVTSTVVFFGESLIAIAVLSGMGVLIHELYAFQLPLVLLMAALKRGGTISQAVSPGVIVLAVFLITEVVAVVVLGKIRISENMFNQAMLAHLPHAASRHHLWSGYFELSSSISDHAALGALGLTRAAQNWIYLVLPVAFVLLVAGAASMTVPERSTRLALFAALVFPMCASFLAWDLYRWLGLSASLSLIVIARSAATGVSGRVKNMLLAFSALGPLGAADPTRPFPLHQFLLERFWK